MKFRLVHPNSHVAGLALNQEDIDVVPGKTLQHYFRERHLIGTRLRCRVVRDVDKQPLRLSYIPQAGDVIVMRKA